MSGACRTSFSTRKFFSVFVLKDGELSPITSSYPVSKCRIQKHKQKGELIMALVVNTNIPSIAAQRYLMESRNEMETAMERHQLGSSRLQAEHRITDAIVARRDQVEIKARTE